MGNIRHIASRVGFVEDFKLIENYRYRLIFFNLTIRSY